MFELLILSRNNKTEFKFYNFSKYEIGQVTGYGWLVIDKRFYYQGRFLTYDELRKEYWKLYDEKLKKRRKNKVFDILGFGKNSNKK